MEVGKLEEIISAYGLKRAKPYEPSLMQDYRALDKAFRKAYIYEKGYRLPPLSVEIIKLRHNRDERVR